MTDFKNESHWLATNTTMATKASMSLELKQSLKLHFPSLKSFLKKLLLCRRRFLET